MKLEVGMYVRTKDGRMGKLMGHMVSDENKIAIWTNTTEEGIKITPVIDKDTIVKASYNIIDILEVGDYVNGSKVIKIENVENYPDLSSIKIEKSDFRYGVYETVFEKDIKSIVTHEQMEQMAYKVGE